MVVLAVGDVCGEGGLSFLEQKLPGIKRLVGADLTVVNGENSAPGGIGITKEGAGRIFSAGADLITTGNHAFHMPGYENLFEHTPALLRPFNLHRNTPGCGSYLFDLGAFSVLVVNLLGISFMPVAAGNYFDAMDDLLKSAPPVVIVDFHAEATGEKIAFARNFDGRASLIYGTHTHVATADETVFPGGTAYITDIGMTGPADSVLGMETSLAVKKQRYSVPVRLAQAKGRSALSGVVAEIDPKTGRAASIERLSVTE